MLSGTADLPGSSTMPVIASKAAFSVSTSLARVVAFCLWRFSSECISE